MTHPETTRPTLAAIRERAGILGITITGEREASILANAQYLHEAVCRLDTIAAKEQARPDTIRR